MTDRELLELAAKAAGYRIDFRESECPRWSDGPWTHLAVFWNPLNEDGDALRVAVKLAMEVYIDTHPDGCACTEVWSTLNPEGHQSRVIVQHEGDPESATRRAIVRAAAELGKQKERG